MKSIQDKYQLSRLLHKDKGIRLEIYKNSDTGESFFLGGIHGTPFRLIEHKLIKSLNSLKIDWSSTEPKKWTITEGMANSNALLFRVLAPMKNADRIRSVSDGIDEMKPEEAAYWLGMVLHRKKPSRVLAALRLLLTSSTT